MSTTTFKHSYFTFEQRAAFPHHDGTGCSVLAQAQLHEEERNPREKEHDEVGDEEHTCGEDKQCQDEEKGGGGGGGGGAAEAGSPSPRMQSHVLTRLPSGQMYRTNTRAKAKAKAREDITYGMFCVTTSSASG